MSDLISRSELLKRLEEWNTSDETDKALYNFTLRRIIEQPTAYSVDKVVEELNKAKDEIASKDYCMSINDKEKCDGRNCFECCAEYLIEIVKQGGVSNDVCEWKKSKDYPFDWLVGCDGCEVNHRQGDYCPRCGKKIKVVE